jgi:hypothetical protein
MAQLSEHQKALKAIERLTGGDFASDLEWNLADGSITDPNLKQAAEIIGKIYMISHAESPKCTGHEDWKKIKDQILKQLEV